MDENDVVQHFLLTKVTDPGITVKA